jgi:hypothetical protein
MSNQNNNHKGNQGNTNNGTSGTNPAKVQSNKGKQMNPNQKK